MAEEHGVAEVVDRLIGDSVNVETIDGSGQTRVRAVHADMSAGDHSLATLASSGFPGAPEIISALGALAETLHEVLRPRPANDPTS